MTTFQSKDIDQVAYIATACGTLPEVLRDTFDGQAIFEFEQRPEIQAALIEYATGAALIPAKRLLATRRRLFHEVRRVTGGAA